MTRLLLKLGGALPLLSLLGFAGCAETTPPESEEEESAEVSSAVKGKGDQCKVLRVDTSTYFIDVVSTLPHFQGLPAKIEVHRAQPVFKKTKCRKEAKAALLQQGRSIDGVTMFDHGFEDYSLMQKMAAAGVDTFTYNQLGYGHSSRFSMSDPCNASNASDTGAAGPQPINQQNLLIPNRPLAAQCPHSDPGGYFTDSAAAIDQLAAVVEHVVDRDRLKKHCDDEDDDDDDDDHEHGHGHGNGHGHHHGHHGHGNHHPHPVRKLNLMSASQGSVVLGPYLALPGVQDNVERVVFLSMSYGPSPLAPLVELPPASRPTWPTGLSDITSVTGAALFQVNAACPGQRNPAIVQSLWDGMKASDPLASSWGAPGPTGGLIRWPVASRIAFNPTQAAAITVPVLLISGALDTTTPPAQANALYTDLGSAKKVIVRLDCASHSLQWEGSTNPSGWRGPHITAQNAIVEWIAKGTYKGATTGEFHSLADGTVVP